MNNFEKVIEARKQADEQLAEEQKAVIKSRSDEGLPILWETVDKYEVNQDVATVRGWIMDEIQSRWPEQFDAWMENCESDDNVRTYIKL